MKKLYDRGDEMVWVGNKLYQIFYSQAQKRYYAILITTTKEYPKC